MKQKWRKPAVSYNVPQNVEGVKCNLSIASFFLLFFFLES